MATELSKNAWSPNLSLAPLKFSIFLLLVQLWLALIALVPNYISHVQQMKMYIRTCKITGQVCWSLTWVFMTRMYVPPLQGPSSNLCGGFRPSAEVFLSFWSKSQA